MESSSQDNNDFFCDDFFYDDFITCYSDDSPIVDKTKEDIKKEKICLPALDAILTDDVEAFTEVINDEELANQKLVIISQKIPKILSHFPPLLSVAAFFGAKEICNYLISMNAKRDATDKNGLSLAHFAAAGGDLQLFKEFVDTENYNDTDICMNYPIHYAALMGHADIVKYIWSKGSDFIKVLSLKMKYPIHLACENGHVDVVDFLLSQNISVNETSDNGKTPLMYAACGGHQKLTNFLLSRNADVNFRDNDGKTALVYAAQSGYLSIVKILISHNATYKNKRRKYNPLVEASGAGHLDIVKYLISQGTDVNVSTSDNVTPLQAAATKKRINVLKYLIEKGAAYDVPISCDYREYENILSFACAKEYNELVKYLLENRYYTADKIPENIVLTCIDKGMVDILELFDNCNVDMTFLIDKMDHIGSIYYRYKKDTNDTVIFILEYLEKHGLIKLGDILRLAKALKSQKIINILLSNIEFDFTVLKANDEIIQKAKSRKDTTNDDDILLEFLCINGQENPDENFTEIYEEFFKDYPISDIATAIKSGVKFSIEFLQSRDIFNYSIKRADKETFDILIEMGIPINPSVNLTELPINVCILMLCRAIKYEEFDIATILFDMMKTLIERGAQIANYRCPIKCIIGCNSYLVFDTIRKNTELTKEYIELHDLVSAAIKSKSIHYFDWLMSYGPDYFDENIFYYIYDIKRSQDNYSYYFFKSIINSIKTLEESETLYNLLFRFQDIELFKQCALKGAPFNTPNFYNALASNISTLTCEFFDELLECGMIIDHEIMQKMYDNKNIINKTPRRSLLSYLIKKYDVDLTHKDILASAIVSCKYATVLVLMQCGHVMDHHKFNMIFLNCDYFNTLYLYSKLLESNYRCSDKFNDQSILVFLIRANFPAGYYLFTRYGYKIDTMSTSCPDSFESAKSYVKFTERFPTPTVRIHSHVHSNAAKPHSPIKSNKN